MRQHRLSIAQLHVKLLAHTVAELLVLRAGGVLIRRLLLLAHREGLMGVELVNRLSIRACLLILMVS